MIMQTSQEGTVIVNEKDKQSKVDEKPSDTRLRKESVGESEGSVDTRSTVGPDNESIASKSCKSDDVALTFPRRLMNMLDEESDGDIIGWLSHGGAFMVYRKDRFEKVILPKYFEKRTKYSSFTRKLNRWGFSRVPRGPETGAFYHPQFKRGGQRLCMQMNCNIANRVKAATANTTSVTSVVTPASGTYYGSHYTAQYGQQYHYYPQYNHYYGDDPMSLHHHHEVATSYHHHIDDAEPYGMGIQEEYLNASMDNSYPYHYPSQQPYDPYHFYQNSGHYVEYYQQQDMISPQEHPRNESYPHDFDTNHDYPRSPPPSPSSPTTLPHYHYAIGKGHLSTTHEPQQHSLGLPQKQNQHAISEITEEHKEVEHQYTTDFDHNVNNMYG